MPPSGLAVAVLDPLWAGLPALLARAGHRVVDEHGGAQVVVLRSSSTLDRARLERLAGAGLGLVVRAGSGLDNVDLETCERLGVTAQAFPGGNAGSVAEVTIGLALALVHRLGEGADGMRAGRFDKDTLIGETLAARRVGVLGFGASGRAAARLYRAVGVAELCAWSRSARAGSVVDGVTMVERDVALAQDVVSLHVPLAPETRHLIGRASADRLAPGALLVNMARRDVVDHELVAALLASGRLAAYAADVLDPQRDRVLIGHPRVLATPHLGAQAESTQRRLAEDVCALITRWGAGRAAA